MESLSIKQWLKLSKLNSNWQITHFELQYDFNRSRYVKSYHPSPEFNTSAVHHKHPTHGIYHWLPGQRRPMLNPKSVYLYLHFIISHNLLMTKWNERYEHCHKKPAFPRSRAAIPLHKAIASWRGWYCQSAESSHVVERQSINNFSRRGRRGTQMGARGGK